jgi:thiamine-monophosphate kinase
VSERSRIALLRARLGRDAPGVRVGIGDDAAVLEPGGLVWTVDVQVEGTHFKADWVSWEDIGWRSFMAAASDLAAMGAEPVAALSSLVLAPSLDDAMLEALARGQAAASLAVAAPVVGGNLARGSETSITTTLLGRAAHPVLRSGARAGDGLWLAGPVGLAAAGLALLVQNAHVENAQIAACLDAWRRPVARLAEGRGLPEMARAAIDVSDGLAHDAAQLAEASGVRIVLDAGALRAQLSDALVTAAALLGRDPLDLALHGGEDYALLAASAQPLPGFVRIGAVEAYDDGARVHLRTETGTEPLTPRGFDHWPEA